MRENPPIGEIAAISVVYGKKNFININNLLSEIVTEFSSVVRVKILKQILVLGAVSNNNKV